MPTSSIYLAIILQLILSTALQIRRRNAISGWEGLGRSDSMSRNLMCKFHKTTNILTLFNNILIVCIGNICRSPMAEGLFIKALGDIKKKNFVVNSAGLGALIGHKPDPAACRLMREKGIDISHYRACQLNTEMIRKADLILVMESSHKAAIEAKEPSAKGKVFRLGEWGGFDIPDPYKQEEKVFESTLRLIEQGVSEWIRKL